MLLYRKTQTNFYLGYINQPIYLSIYLSICIYVCVYVCHILLLLGFPLIE